MSDLKASRHITRRDVPAARRLLDRGSDAERPLRPKGPHDTLLPDEPPESEEDDVAAKDSSR
jgi:hypothetical protein